MITDRLIRSLAGCPGLTSNRQPQRLRLIPRLVSLPLKKCSRPKSSLRCFSVFPFCAGLSRLSRCLCRFTGFASQRFAHTPLVRLAGSDPAPEALAAWPDLSTLSASIGNAAWCPSFRAVHGLSLFDQRLENPTIGELIALCDPLTQGSSLHHTLRSRGSTR